LIKNAKSFVKEGVIKENERYVSKSNLRNDNLVYDVYSQHVFRRPNSSKHFFKVYSDGITSEEYEEYL